MCFSSSGNGTLGKKFHLHLVDYLVYLPESKALHSLGKRVFQFFVCAHVTEAPRARASFAMLIVHLLFLSVSLAACCLVVGLEARERNFLYGFWRRPLGATGKFPSRARSRDKTGALFFFKV